MALGVLGALQDHDALEMMEETALNSTEDLDVRWEAVRQALGLEPSKGLDLLQTLANGKAEPLAEPAKALSLQLLQAQPELRELMEQEAC